MKQWVLVGHRGVGKSSLLKKLSKQFPNFHCSSLDKLIQEKNKKSIPEIFESEKEEGFRRIEKDSFTEFIKTNKEVDFILDLGAGFQGNIPSDINVLWVKRKTSSPDNMFLDRPNLDGSLKMDLQRFQQREELYFQISDLSVELREGDNFYQIGEEIFFNSLFGDKSVDSLGKYKFTLKNETSNMTPTTPGLSVYGALLVV